jgi:hypothetical protein
VVSETTWRRHRINPDDEASLADFIERGEHLLAVWYAILRLREIGTVRSLPALEKALYYGKTDVKMAALATIARIRGAEGGSYYIARLEDPKFPEKWTAIRQIARYCGPEGVPAVARRVKAILARKRKRIVWSPDLTQTELTTAVDYLERSGKVTNAGAEAMAEVKEKWMELNEQERKTLLQLPAFAGMPLAPDTAVE